MRPAFARRNERGQTLPLVAFAMFGLIGLTSMAVDFGYWSYQQRLMQTAADSAAIAGTTELAYSNTLASIASAAQTDSASNGFTNGANNTTVTVNNPPLSGSYAGNTQAVEVIVSKQLPVHFAALFGQSSTVVSARAVGMLTTVNRNCIFALDSSNNAAITEDDATITMPKCGMISNGGFLFNQGTITAASIGHAGSNITVNNTVFPSASPQTSVQAADPCPTVSGCAYLKANPPAAGNCASQTTFNSSTTITINPGTYCAQVIFEGGGNVVFNPGLYIFESGFVNNSSPSMSGTGVTFYIQGGNIIINGNPTINFSAPTTGNYAGVLVYQPASNTQQFIINSGTSQTSGGWAGMIYVPGGEIVIDGVMSSWLLVVADDILLNSSSKINDSNSAFPNFTHAVLAE
jgi:Flp pilus assembly protein TadG